MIITHLLAENVLKYQRLELADLPREGVVCPPSQRPTATWSLMRRNNP